MTDQPPPGPDDGVIVRLRDVTLADADLLDAWESDPAVTGTFNDFGMAKDPIDRAALAAGPLRNERNGKLMIERIADGAPIGTVSWHAVRNGPNRPSEAWNVGVALIPDARDHGCGTEAQRLLVRYLFATTDVNRIEASTDIENHAEQRSLEKAGLLREGVARGAQFRSGGYHDLVVYARVRGDLER